MIEPHGGTLVDRVVAPAERDDLVRQATGLPAVKLSPRQASDAEARYGHYMVRGRWAPYY